MIGHPFVQRTMDRQPAVYILANKPFGTIYVGVTSDLVKRVAEHREGITAGFTKKYEVKRLVYFEFHSDMYSAIAREKQIKKWKRDWKVELIEKDNPGWEDLFEV